MADEDRSPSAAVDARALCDEATAYDFFQLLRRIEQLRPDLPRLGEALLPDEEGLRAGQNPSLSFAPSAVMELAPLDDERARLGDARAQRLRLDVTFFGMFGPQGPLPTAMTELVLDARERARREHRREPISDFVDMFHHRLLLLLYRVWASSRAVVSHDRPEDDHFAGYVAALFGGLEEPALDRQARIRTPAGESRELLHMAARLADPRRNAEGLEALIASWLGVEVHLEPLIGEWLDVPEDYAWRLSTPSPSHVQELGVLGESAVLGPQVYERQHKFRLVIGPIDAGLFQALSPGSDGLSRLRRRVRSYVGDALQWDLVLRVMAGAITPFRLGAAQRLGESTYLIEAPTERVVDHLVDPFLG